MKYKVKRAKTLKHTPNYAAAIFLLSADEELWDTVSKNVLDTGIYFDRIRLGLDNRVVFYWDEVGTIPKIESAETVRTQDREKNCIVIWCQK